MGLALMLEGYSAADAIQLMRDKRSNAVLLNEEFVDYLILKDVTRSE
jgi:hypothetical protein